MIIFYQKSTGVITGVIEGRIHNEYQLKMCIGDSNETEKIVCQWIKLDGKYQPDNEPKDIFIELDAKPVSVYNYVVNTKTKLLENKK